ncbi:DUF4231 domain-containing protein [Streptomyces sp. MCA2]|uniref:DUF4231 domain-containing protein n=1 Tax=Streptomyces sp. MCA2 TaxID=2944805 RepID=UPI0020203319|nr:DUF4231 domain-containing protein [Streptomyces sp. MCA2]MCL7496036.1 DUF4231 domain-containing protein [Streptomyces sp. MCA2]
MSREPHDEPRRLTAAEEGLSTAERQLERNEQLQIHRLRALVRTWEHELADRNALVRRHRISVALAITTALVATSWTMTHWGLLAEVLRVAIPCGVVFFASLGAAVFTAFRLRRLHSKEAIEDGLATNRDALRFLAAVAHPSLSERRSLYRADTAGLIEQYQKDSRKYRRVHNSLQSLVMVGSAFSTLVAGLETGKELTWQSVTLVVISVSITLASTFTGYYKYRERSYFLQQTADSIEEEANGYALGVGPYGDFGAGQEGQALALFTKRVEDLRNEQRRRQQQLDQPAEQTVQNGQPQG